MISLKHALLYGRHAEPLSSRSLSQGFTPLTTYPQSHGDAMKTIELPRPAKEFHQRIISQFDIMNLGIAIDNANCAHKATEERLLERRSHLIAHNVNKPANNSFEWVMARDDILNSIERCVEQIQQSRIHLNQVKRALSKVRRYGIIRCHTL